MKQGWWKNRKWQSYPQVTAYDMQLPLIWQLVSVLCWYLNLEHKQNGWLHAGSLRLTSAKELVQLRMSLRIVNLWSKRMCGCPWVVLGYRWMRVYISECNVIWRQRNRKKDNVHGSWLWSEATTEAVRSSGEVEVLLTGYEVRSIGERSCLKLQCNGTQRCKSLWITGLFTVPGG